MSKEDNSSFRVYVRIRPLSERELSHNNPRKREKILKHQENVVWIEESRGTTRKEHSFAFNEVFTEEFSNQDVYNHAVAPLVEVLVQGYHSTCFAYGMTSAGKTHTMLGDMYLSTAFEPGIVFLSVNNTFELLRRSHNLSSVKLSYLEIYNEHVRDLLNTEGNDLMIVEDPIRGIVVPELTEYNVSDIEQVKELILQGNSKRTMAPTGANQFSTRSHAVLQITVEQKPRDRKIVEEVLVSKLSLIDLAGSERASVTENRGQRMVEGANINRSLLALGNCINILSDSRKKGQFVPYRDSKLTRLLKDSLGGNTKTVMIACVSPARLAIEETLNTLKYAERARKIKKKVVRNVNEVEAHVSEYQDIIKSLRNEVEYLKTQLSRQGHESNAVEDLSEEFYKSQAEKRALEQELKNEHKAIESLPNSQTVEQLSQILLNNFEEHWEIKQSIREIDNLNEANKVKIKSLLSQIEKCRQKGDNSMIEPMKQELTCANENVRENEEMRNELLEHLYTNLKQKSELQRALASMSTDKRKEVLQLQIELRTLKLEKLDLHMQNIKIKQEAIEAHQASEAKDKVISQMKKELDEMKKRLHEKEMKKELKFELQNHSGGSASKESYISDEDYYSKAISEIPHPVEDDKIMKLSYYQETEENSSYSSPNSVKPRISQLDEIRAIRKSTARKTTVPMKDTMRFLESYKPCSSKELEEDPVPNVPKSMSTKTSKLRSCSVTTTRKSTQENSKPKVAKISLIQNNLRGAFSNMHHPVSNPQERYKSVDRSKKQPQPQPQKNIRTKRSSTPSQRPKTAMASRGAKPTQVKEAPSTPSSQTPSTSTPLGITEASSLNKLASFLNTKILSPEEAALIVKKTWAIQTRLDRKKTPAVTISLSKI
jgi:kinesin family protein 18/19